MISSPEKSKCCQSEMRSEAKPSFRFLEYLPALATFSLLITGILLGHYDVKGFHPAYELAIFLTAYLIVGWEVLWKALKGIAKGQVFGEHFLMSVATLGAIAIHQYAEGVAVMLFYEIGELFQDAAINRSKRSIKALLDIRPQIAKVLRNGNFIELSPTQISIGETVQALAGEKIALDGTLLSETGAFDTAALTGESRPRFLKRGDLVLSGMINLNQVIEIEVTRRFENSTLAKI
ncbi:MAG: heavy metal translocating P-type ATPase, partial [Deltaproteobacteria bacterium]|nr:heavy metal translocating P-type ATPase [Deltaproteobacteria bacterium]